MPDFILPGPFVSFNVTGPAYAPPGLVVNVNDPNSSCSAPRTIDIGRECRAPRGVINFDYNQASSSRLKSMVVPCLDENYYLTRIPTTEDEYLEGGVPVPWFSGVDFYEYGWYWNLLGSPAKDYRAGRYRFTWDGGPLTLTGPAVSEVDTSETNQIEFTVSNVSNMLIQVRVSTITGEDYPRNFKCMKTDDIAAYEGGARFNADAIADLRRLRTVAVRSLDTIGTNNASSISGGIHTTWAQRNTSTRLAGRWSWEEHIDYCNAVPAPMWATVPHLADDDYIENLAELIKDRLDTNLPCYVEYSNETWNDKFPQGKWIIDQAEANWPGNKFTTRHSWHAKFAVRLALGFNAVFTGGDRERIIHVMAAQAGGGGWQMDKRLVAPDWQANEPGEYVDPRTVFDAVSVSNYFGNNVTGNADRRQELHDTIGEENDYEAAAQLVHDWCTGGNESPYNYLGSARSNWRSVKGGSHGKPMIAYEGGSHMLHAAFVGGSSSRIVNFFRWFRDTELYLDIMQRHVDIWQQEMGENAPMSPFVDYDMIWQWGDFALLQHPGEDAMHMSFWEDVSPPLDPWPWDND